MICSFIRALSLALASSVAGPGAVLALAGGVELVAHDLGARPGP